MPPVVQLAPALFVLVQHQGQEKISVAKPRSTLHRNPLQLFPDGGHVVRYSGQALGFETLLDLGDGGTHANVPTVHVALVQGGSSGATGVRLTHDAAHQLGHGSLRCRVVEHDQHVGEGTVPAFHQGSLGNDPPHGRVFGQQVHAGQFVLFGRLDRDLARRHAQVVHQVLAHVFRVDASSPALIFSRALDPHHCDWPDITTVGRVQRPRLRIQPLELFAGLRQRVLPLGADEGLDAHRQLDHLFGLQFHAGHVHQQVADAAIGRGRQLHHQAGVQLVDRSHELGVRFSSLGAVGLVGFVQYDNGTQQLEGVEQAVLDQPVRALVEVRVSLQQPRVASQVVSVGKQRGVAPRVAKDAEELASLPAVGGGKHEQHHAQVVGHVPLIERMVLLQHLDPSAARAFQHLSVRMPPIPQRFLRLSVDRPGRRDPEREPGLSVETFQRGGCKQGLAPAGRDLEARRGESSGRRRRFAQRTRPRRMRPRPPWPALSRRVWGSCGSRRPWRPWRRRQGPRSPFPTCAERLPTHRANGQSGPARWSGSP